MKKLTIILLLFCSTFSFAGEKWIQDDKAAHFLAGALVSQSTYHFVLNKTNDKRKATIWAIATPLIIGTLKECADKAQGKPFSLKDIGATALGVTIIIPIKIL